MANQATQMTQPPYAAEKSADLDESDYSVGPIQGVTRGASSVMNDAFDLAELQAQLLAADTRSFMDRVKFGLLGMVITLAFLIAALPVAALGVAEGLAWGLQWPLWVCMLGTSVFLLVMGLGLGLWCLQRFRTSLKSFGTSRQEAGENIRWLRQALSKTFSN